MLDRAVDLKRIEIRMNNRRTLFVWDQVRMIPCNHLHKERRNAARNKK